MKLFNYYLSNVDPTAYSVYDLLQTSYVSKIAEGSLSELDQIILENDDEDRQFILVNDDGYVVDY